MKDPLNDLNREKKLCMTREFSFKSKITLIWPCHFFCYLLYRLELIIFIKEASHRCDL